MLALAELEKNAIYQIKKGEKMSMILMASFMVSMVVSMTLLWGVGVIKSMKLGKGRLTIIATNTLVVTIAIIGLLGLVCSATIFTIWLHYVIMM